MDSLIRNRISLFAVFLFLLTSCSDATKSTETQSRDFIGTRDPLDDACTKYGVRCPDDNSNPQDDPANPSPTQEPATGGSGSGGGVEPGDYEFGKESLGGHGGQGKNIPITFVFVNSSSKTLSSNAEADANLAIEKMNELFAHNGHQYIQFYLKRYLDVVDDLYHNTSCNSLSTIANKYGQTDSLVMLFVNDLSGSCAGVSYLWVFPSNTFAVTMAEYRYSFEQDRWTPVVHEFTHSMGVHHTGNEYNGAVPTTGLREFNDLLGMGGRNGSRRCQNPFEYYIDPIRRKTDREINGYLFNSYHNTMYPSFGGQPDNGFFNTEGYAYSFSWAFDCWYKEALKDL